MTAALDIIRGKLADGERLSGEEARALTATRDLIALGMLGEGERSRRHGDRVTFVRVAQVSVDTGRPADVPEPPPACGELRLVGVPHRVGSLVDWVGAAAARAGGRPLSGFSLADLLSGATRDGVGLSGLLERLRVAGLEMVAEAPLDRLASPDAALAAVRDAGLVLARVTLEAVDRESDWLARVTDLVALQDRLGGVRVFAPLARSAGAVPSTGYDDVRRVALARLLADNIESIQVDWALHGPKLAQVALTFGADDLDAVPARDDLTQGPRRAPLEDIRRHIRAAGLVPVERNGRFETDRR